MNWFEREYFGLPVWEWCMYALGFALGVSGYLGQL